MHLQIMSKYLRKYKTLLLSTFSFILGCMLTINVAPIDRTCKLENTDREYNIMSNSKLKSPEMILLILSAPKNLDRRNTIRETWLKLSTHKNGNDIKFKHYFIVGSLGLTIDQMLHLTSEQSQFNDILIVPVYDSYKNLTEKMMKSFIWLTEQIDIGLDFKYVLKCDDDSFVRLDSIAHEIQQLEIMYVKADIKHLLNDKDKSPYITINIQVNKEDKFVKDLMLYWGYFDGDAHIHRGGKYKETSWILSDTYLPYALGGGYILSKGLVTYIGKNSNYLRYYNSEDVSVGVWVAGVKNIIRIHDRRFNTEWISRGCQNYYLVSHNLTMKQTRKMYENIVKKGYLCDVETIRRDDYMYNWSLPTSKCCTKT